MLGVVLTDFLPSNRLETDRICGPPRESACKHQEFWKPAELLCVRSDAAYEYPSRLKGAPPRADQSVGKAHTRQFNVVLRGASVMSDGTNNSNKPPRRRGLTSLTLEWIAEKFRRANKIKEELAQGSYQVDSDKVAKAIVEGTSGNNHRH